MGAKSRSLATLVVAMSILFPATAFAQVNSTHADGLAAYGELSVATPRFRTWDATNNFSIEDSSQSILGEITWVVVKGNHERNEILMGTEDTSNDVNIQVYSGNAWGNLLEVSTDAPNAAYRAFDIAVEDLSGDALIAYAILSAAALNISYIVWNGTGYGDAQVFSPNLSSSAMNWISLTAKPGSDEIMMLIQNDLSHLYAVPWNGTSFDTSKELLLSTTAASTTEEHFGFAWESSSGDGLAVYGEVNNLVYRQYTSASETWDSPLTIDLGDNLDSTRLCADTTSDYIGFIVQDAGNDVEVRMWNGSTVLSGPPGQDAATEPAGINSNNADCAWQASGTQAIFAYTGIDNLSLTYFNFSKSTNAWSVSNIIEGIHTPNFAVDDIKIIRLTANPATNEVMAIVHDIAKGVTAILWNGTNFSEIIASPLETSSSVLNGRQEAAMFDWFRYDTPPGVTAISPSQGNGIAQGTLINITANVTDNLAVDSVLANITFPNGTVQQLTLYDADNDSRYISGFANTTAEGTYTIRVVANDTSRHHNYNTTQSASFTVGDTLAPNVTILLPVAGSNFNQSGNVTIRANVTDDRNVSSVIANITLPDGTVGQLVMVNLSNNVSYEANTSSTILIGTYTVRIIANDTSNNVNSSVTGTFSVGDSSYPLVANVSPQPGADFSAGDAVNLTANVTDNTNVSAVSANITLPNGFAQLAELFSSGNPLYNVTFSNTTLAGRYNVTFIANDTANNVNNTVTTYFNVGDVIAPTLTINSPDDLYNISASSIAFNFTPADETSGTLNCSIYIDGVINQSNTLVTSGVATIFSVQGIINGLHNWSIACRDDTGNPNSSSARLFTIDALPPLFVSLSTQPSSENDVDPGVNITVRANVSENLTVLDTVIFQYKLSNDTLYTNLSMPFNSSLGLYTAVFNATTNGTYNLRLRANDSAGNSDTSNLISLVVAHEKTWSRSPSVLGPIVANLYSNATLGNITLNLTGDFPLNFSINSSSAQTSYSNQSNFTLEPGNLYTLTVIDNATQAPTKTIVLNISSSGANNSLKTTTGTIVTAVGQPVLIASFTTPASESITVSQGDSNVRFIAKVSNLGDSAARNITLNITLPVDWVITLGSASVSFDQLLPNESDVNLIEARIPSDAGTGTKNVYANATGVNATGIPISQLGFTFGDSVTVELQQEAAPLGSGSGGTSTPPSGSPAVAGGGGSSVSMGGAVRKIESGKAETIYTTDTVIITRGSSEALPVTISNLFENSVLEDIKLEVLGFKSQYINITEDYSPDIIVHVETLNVLLAKTGESVLFNLTGLGQHRMTLLQTGKSVAKLSFQSQPVNMTLSPGQSKRLDIDRDNKSDTEIALEKISGDGASLKVHRLGNSQRGKLFFLEKRNYSVQIFTPSYLDGQVLNLTVRITGTLAAVNPELAGFTQKPFTEFRTLNFRIIEVVPEQLVEAISKAQGLLQEMKQLGFPAGKAEALFQQANDAFEAGDYELSSSLVDELAGLHDSAITAFGLISDIEAGMQNAVARLLSVQQTRRALELAWTAFERGDFQTAIERARDAELILALETRNKVSAAWLVQNYWWAMLLGIGGLTAAGYILYRKAMIYFTIMTQKRLAMEELSILSLLEELQKKRFKEGSISAEEYEQRLSQFDSQLNRIKQQRARLRHRRVGLVRKEEELRNLRKEEEEMQRYIQILQKDYLESGLISQRQFRQLYASDKERMVELQEEEEVLKEQLKGSRFRMFADRISRSWKSRTKGGARNGKK